MKKRVNFILLNLVALDVVLSGLCLFAPTIFTTIMHGGEYADPLGMLRRLGAVWAAFVLFQFLAWRRWEREPYWLVLVAGVRWTELFSDWVYWYSADKLTWFGNLGLLISPPANAIMGYLLLKAFKERTAGNKQ